MFEFSVAAGRWLLLPVWYDGYKDAMKTEVILWIRKQKLRVVLIRFDGYKIKVV